MASVGADITVSSAGVRDPQGLRLTTSVPAATVRLAFVDNLRVALTVLVVAHHAGQAYGPTGGRWPVTETDRAAILGTFFTVNAAFFMGLFFFVSAYFLPRTFERKGATAFLRDRLVRLGLPLLFFALLVFGADSYFTYASKTPEPVGFLTYLYRIYPGQVEVAHLWFVAHLLVYALLYTIIATVWQRLRLVRGSSIDEASNGRSHRDRWVPGHRAIAGYVVTLAAVTFAVRIAYPVDVWLPLFGVRAFVEIAHLPQYASLFVLGLIAARQNWLTALPAQVGYQWLAVGFVAALLRFALPALGPVFPLAGGGFSLGSLLWSAWEAVICVGLVVGLLVLFRGHVNGQSGWLLRLSRAAYGVYLVHLLIVIGVQFALKGLAAPALLKFGIGMFVGVALSFLVADGLRRIPGLRGIL